MVGHGYVVSTLKPGSAGFFIARCGGGMDITAGKLRACGWLIILVGATAIALMIALLFPGRIDPTQQFFNRIFYKGYLPDINRVMV